MIKLITFEADPLTPSLTKVVKIPASEPSGIYEIALHCTNYQLQVEVYSVGSYNPTTSTWESDKALELLTRTNSPLCSNSLEFSNYEFDSSTGLVNLVYDNKNTTVSTYGKFYVKHTQGSDSRVCRTIFSESLSGYYRFFE